jgi:1-aminocyclopropane-1-carboxylate deaminase
VLPYFETPVQTVHHAVLKRAGVTLEIKREDKNHPSVSGNKWWKLKHNLESAISQGHDTLLTFGGAYSNHLFATAAAAKALGMKSIGVVRGEQTLPLNETLHAAGNLGMMLHYLPRNVYRDKHAVAFTHKLKDRFGPCYIIPEGGTNALAVDGVAEFASGLGDGFDFLCCPVGTGGTLAGLIRGTNARCKVLGFPVLKGGQFLSGEIETLVPGHIHWDLIHDYHFGGYGRTTPVLDAFIREFSNRQQIPLEFVYSGKMLFGILDMVSKGFFSQGCRIMAIHTGGIR